MSPTQRRRKEFSSTAPSYRELIAQVTGESDPGVLATIEDFMRHDVVHSSLDWLDQRAFNGAARSAYQLWVTAHVDPSDMQIMRAFSCVAAEVPIVRKEIALIREEVSAPRTSSPASHPRLVG
jgi:hypothetical protein